MKKSYWIGLCGVLVLMAAPRVSAQSMEMTSAKLYINQNEWDKAIHWLEEALKKKPDNAEAHFLLAQGYGQKGRMTDMLTEFTAAEQHDKKGKYSKDIKAFRQKYFAESFNAGVKAFNEQDFEAAAEKFSSRHNRPSIWTSVLRSANSNDSNRPLPKLTFPLARIRS